MIAGLSNLRNPKISVMNGGEEFWHNMMFLKLKSDDVTIKGKGCAYRRKTVVLAI